MGGMYIHSLCSSAAAVMIPALTVSCPALPLLSAIHVLHPLLLRPLQLFNSGNLLLQVAMFVYDRVSNALLPSFLTSRHNRAMP